MNLKVPYITFCLVIHSVQNLAAVLSMAKITDILKVLYFLRMSLVLSPSCMNNSTPTYTVLKSKTFKKQNIMKRTSSGNFILSSEEFIDLSGFVSYLLSLPRDRYEDYLRVDNVMLSEHDITFFKKIDRLCDESFLSKH